MKKMSFTLLLILATALLVRATDTTWTDSTGDHDWGNANNWNTLAVPGTADKAIFPLAIGSVTNYVVNMNGDRSVKEIAFASAGKNQIYGPANTLTMGGNILGGSSAILSTKIVFTVDATVKCTDNYGNKIFLAGGVESPYSITFSGSVNNGMTITSGVYRVPRTTIDAPTTIIDCLITNSMLTLANSWSDSNGNRTGLTLYSTVNFTDSILTIDKNAGAISFSNQDNTNASIQTILRKIDHKQGNLGITLSFYGGTNIVTVQDFACSPGSFVRISNSKLGAATFNAGVNAGLVIVGATNTNGTYKPNFMSTYLLTKVNANGALEQCSASTDYTALPVATYSPSKMYRWASSTDITLTQDSEVWAWLIDNGTDRTLDLGSNNLTIGSGNFALNGSGVKNVISGGGKLIFGGDDVILYAGGTTGSLIFSAPLAWRKPAESTVQYPSLIFSGTGLPEVLFSGVDEIGDYNALNAEAGKSMTSIIFAGPSNRNFHGKLTGRNSIYNRGTGTLTFSGADERRSAAFYAESGTTIFAYTNAVQLTSATNGAVCIVADGVAYSKRLNVYDGGIICMAGNTASVGYQPVNVGGRLDGGAPGQVGTFRVTGDFQPSGNFSIGMKIAATTNSLLSLSKFIIPPVTGGATITIRVSDISGGNRTIHKGDVLTVATATSFTNTTYPMNFVVVSDSPTSLDASTAVASYNLSTKTITVTGLNSLRGTVISIR